LAGLRAAGVWLAAGQTVPVVEPVWSEVAGPPAIRGLAVRFEPDRTAWVHEVPALPYFADAARALVAAKVEAGVVSGGDRVRYGVLAFERDEIDPPATARRFETVERAAPSPVADRPFTSRFAGAITCGGGVDDEIMPVGIPEEVLDEICGLALAAGERETGGLLIGHLCREAAALGLEVTAQIAARHTEGDSTKVTFTSDTWTDVRAALALRRAGELIVGYWHSHPAFHWCAACPAERQARCQLASGFLSSDDKALHRVMFPAAYTQSLVITRSIAGLEAKLFGWSGGTLAARGFGLIPATSGPLARAREAIRHAAPAALAVACKSSDGGDPQRSDLTTAAP
jgi:hypothetical protein